MAVDEAALDAFLADPTTPGGDQNPDGRAVTEAPASAPAAPTAPAASEEAASIPARETPAPAAPAADQTEDKWDPETRKYIESLRSESARYRQRGQRYNEVFDGYEDDAVNEWLELANTLKSDPKAAAERFQTIAQAILEAEQETAPPVDHAAEAEVLTRADFERMMAERDQQADLARRVAGIEADATKLGYEVGSDDYQELLYIASTLPSGSIQEAHQKIAARNQAVIDRYVASLGQKPAPEVPSQGAPASGERQLKTFDDANKALDAWLAGIDWS